MIYAYRVNIIQMSTICLPVYTSKPVGALVTVREGRVMSAFTEERVWPGEIKESKWTKYTGTGLAQ